MIASRKLMNMAKVSMRQHKPDSRKIEINFPDTDTD
jgi:hypothetical protein